MNKDIKSYIDEYEKIHCQIDAYEKQINDLRIILDEKLKVLEEQMVYFKRKFEREISPINDKIDKCHQELNRFSLNHKIRIRLGDIINEILSITEIDQNDIEVWGTHSFVSYPPLSPFEGTTLTRKSILEYVATHTGPVNLYIYIDFKNQDALPSIHFDFESTLSDIDFNGKMLIEHSKINPTQLWTFEKNGKSKLLDHATVQLYDEGLEDIFCSFNLKQIIDFKNNYENDILSKAVINCLNKQKVQEKSNQKHLHI